jgi:hypothetical protein
MHGFSIHTLTGHRKKKKETPFRHPVAAQKQKENYSGNKPPKKRSDSQSVLHRYKIEMTVY